MFGMSDGLRSFSVTRRFLSVSVSMAIVLAISSQPFSCNAFDSLFGGKKKTYRGTVKLNPAAGITRKNVEVRYGEGKTTTLSENGGFSIRGSVETTGTLSAVGDKGNTIMKAVYPKSDCLPEREAELDWVSTAAALVFQTPGIATPEPVAAAALLDLIRKQPETQQLADMLEKKSAQDPGIVDRPDAEVFGLVAVVVGRVQALSDQAQAYSGCDNKILEFSGGASLAGSGSSRRAMPGLSYLRVGDQESGPLANTDDSDADGVDFSVTFDGETARLHATNNYMRWVAVYIDPVNTKDPRDEIDRLIPVALLEPRNAEIPTFGDLVQDLVFDNLEGVAADIWSGKEASQDDLMNRGVENLKKHVLPTETDFEKRLHKGTQYLLSAYGPGMGSVSEPDIRELMPVCYTALTELIMPGLGLVIDFSFDPSPLLKRTPEMIQLVKAHRDQACRAMQVTTRGNDQTAAAIEWTKLAVELAQDSRFYSIVAGCYGVGKSIVSNAVGLVISLLSNVLGAINIVIGGINLIIGAVGVVIAVLSCQHLEQYYLSTTDEALALKNREQVPSAEPPPELEPITPSEPEPPPSGGALATAKAFYTALANGDTATAVDLVYKETQEDELASWGIFGLYNAIGVTEFKGMDYSDELQQGDRVAVHTTGDMIVSDRLGLSTVVCHLDGETVLIETSGGWKVFGLPSYTMDEPVLNNEPSFDLEI